MLSYGVHDLQEAGILPGLNNLAFDVSNQIPEPSWYGTLLKGTVNFTRQHHLAPGRRLGALPRPHDDGLRPAGPAPPRPTAPHRAGTLAGARPLTTPKGPTP